MENDDLKQISKKLSLLIALTLKKLESKSTLTELVKLLSAFGISNSDIALILGAKKSTVEVLKSRTNKEKR